MKDRKHRQVLYDNVTVFQVIKEHYKKSPLTEHPFLILITAITFHPVVKQYPRITQKFVMVHLGLHVFISEFYE